MIEQRSFRIHEHDDLDQAADELDAAFADGWQHVTHFSVGRGILVVLARVKAESQNGAAPKKQLAKAAGR